MALCQSCHRFGIGPITLGDPIRHIEGGLNGKLLEKINQQGRRRAAIYVIIGKNSNFLLILNGCEQNLCGCGAIFERERIAHTDAEGRVEEIGDLGRSNPQTGHHIAQRQWQIALLMERQSISFNRESGPEPPAI